MARVDFPVHRQETTRRSVERGAGHLLLRLRPDRGVAAYRQSRAADQHASPSGRRASSDRLGRRRDRSDWRPPPVGRAHPQPEGRRRRLGRTAQAADRRHSGNLRRQSGAFRLQLRLDRADVRHRLPARRRQELPTRHHAGQGHGRASSELRGGHLLHGIQLPGAAGQRLPSPVRRVRLHAGNRAT